MAIDAFVVMLLSLLFFVLFVFLCLAINTQHYLLLLFYAFYIDVPCPLRSPYTTYVECVEIRRHI
jgi:hypothetical protein